MLTTFWSGLGRAARASFVACVVLLMLLAGGAASWLLRTDYQVLFADLAPQDAGAMVAELERMKVPYKLGEGGSSILVDREAVHKTRIKLMGKDLPLHGTVGFELFNTADFGMTEFAQKVNYQRALQGEISRTILSLSEIEAVRVHLALPEESLFKRASSKAKASITLTMKRGQSLRAQQVAGIQRLVAASVPGIVAEDVTIVDQHGVAQTRAAQGEAEGEPASRQLELKRETEAYLSRKADAVLERRFGAGQALASIDVLLDMDQVRITTEDVVGAPARIGQAPAGVMVRERETIRDNGASGNARTAEAGGSSQREVDYQVGRRVEQIVAAPGSVRRLHVAVVVRSALDATQLEQVRALVAAAVGASRERGDTVVVQALAGTAASDAAQAPAPTASLHSAGSEDAAPLPRADGTVAAVLIALITALLAGLAIGSLALRRRSPGPVLSMDERQAALAQLRLWLAEDKAAVHGLRQQEQA